MVDDWTLDVTDKDIDAALEDARTLPPQPSALSAEYNPTLDVIVIRLNTGRRLVLPREDLQGLRDATPEQIADIQIFGPNDICWPQLDLDHNLYSLLEGRYGNDRWMQQIGNPAAAA